MYKRSSLSPINLAAVVIAIMIYLTYLLGRIGMGDNLNILPLLLSVSILVLPAILKDLCRLHEALLQFLILIFFLAWGWISILLDIDLSILLYATGIISIFFIFRSAKFSINKETIIGGLLAIFLAFKLISILWTTNFYLSVLAPEAYAIKRLHIDTLYLAGITSIIQTYQVTSTGMFGLVPIQYHAGSNYLFAAYSQLCHLGAIPFYNFAFPVIFAPLFFQALLSAAFSHLKRKPDGFKLIIGFLILFFVLSGFLPNSVGQRFLLFPSLNNHFLSESYCLSLILTLLFISVYSPFFKTNQLDSRRDVNILLILMIPVWIFAIGFAKISTAVILFGAFCYVIVRRRLFFQKGLLLSVILTIIHFPYLLYLTVESNRSATFAIDPGSFYKYYVNESLPIYFFLHYGFLLLVILSYLFFFKRKNEGIFRQLIAGKYLVLETIIVAAVAGLMPGLLIEIEGGSALYFADVQNWFCIIAIIGLAPFLIYKYYRYLAGFKTALRILLFVLLVVIVRDAVFRSLYSFIKQNLGIRVALMYGSDPDSLKAPVKLDRVTVLGQEIRSAILARLNDRMEPAKSPRFNEQIQKLKLPLMEELRTLPPEVKKRSLIYCEDLAELPKFKDCGEAFYLTALTGIALINGLHWKPCFPSGEYAWRYYPEVPIDMSRETALQLARENGFSNVIVLNLKNNSFSIVAV